ncbi:MAG TPA: iron-sulfur cluster repair di-iron protein [Terriglobales bacterium]|nr:iron-sulfur cluster repair di-iron protein [Terriglobales bacterium]
MTTKTAKTVAEIALETPRAASLFEEFGIDYCCGGEKTLQEACNEARVALAEVEAALQEVRDARESAEARDWSAESLAQLVAHIVNFHHQYVRRALPRIEQLLGSVLSAHGQKHHDLAKVQRHFHVLADEMVRHMMKEEQVLFPYIIRMEDAAAGGEAVAAPTFGTVKNPIRMMRSEHDSIGLELREIRKLSKDYDTPKEQCNSFRALYNALEEFERERNQHIHLENEILFPRAEALEARAGRQ